MSFSNGHFERFIRRLHRRQVAVRIVERAGIALLAGCGVAILLMLLLIWRGQPAFPVALSTLAIAIVGGVAWGVVERPSQLASAIEADRQLHLSDLLSTALTLPQEDVLDQWASTILRSAEEHCRRLNTSAVVLGRLGGAGMGRRGARHGPCPYRRLPGRQPAQLAGQRTTACVECSTRQRKRDWENTAGCLRPRRLAQRLRHRRPRPRRGNAQRPQRRHR